MITGTIGLVLTVFGIASLLGGAWAVLKAGGKTASVALWREEAEAQKARADRLEIAVEALESRVHAVEMINRQLADMATGKAAIEVLAVQIRDNHASVITILEAIAHAGH